MEITSVILNEGSGAMFRYKSSIPVSYERQGYIYFTSRLYRELPERSQERIRTLCRQAGGEHWEALLEYVTAGASADSICTKHHLSYSSLLRAARRYFKLFPIPAL